MSKNTSSTYKQVVIEMFSIIIAVTLAFSLESWREEKKNENLGKTAFKDIINELKDNHEMLIKRDTLLGSFVKDLGEIIEQDVNETDFTYNTILYKRTAWETSLLSDANRYIEYEKLKDLKNIYSIINLAHSVNQKIIDIMTSVDFHDDNRSKASQKALLNNANSLISLNKNITIVIELIFKKYKIEL